MPEDFYPIVGRKDTEKIFDRIPVEEMQTDKPYQFALFVLGYAAIQGNRLDKEFVQDVDWSPKLGASFREIASIHGRPYHKYAGDPTPIEDPKAFGGYCNHGTITFPGWHRPYVMLIEQAIGEYATLVASKIAEQYPDEEDLWKTAAVELRFPYWDWADPKVAEEGLPSLLHSDTIDITTPGKRTKTVQNPLAFYSFGPDMPEGFAEFKRGGNTAFFQRWHRTFRYAPNVPEATQSDIATLQKFLKERAEGIRRQVGTLFAFRDDRDASKRQIYDEFATTHPQSLNKDFDQFLKDGPKKFLQNSSLEAVHNTIHYTSGGNGHMSNPDYAAFDPFFFFHHSNCDRLLALWEWCYPQYWMGDGYTVDGQKVNWTQQIGNRKDGVGAGNSKPITSGNGGYLAPFMKEDGTYWTGEDARFLRPGAPGPPKWYSYKEFQGVKVDLDASPEERVKARGRIMAYYGYDALTARDQKIRGVQHIPVGDYLLPAHYKTRKGFHVFQIQVALPEFAFNGSYEFELSYTRPGQEAKHIGCVTVFARSDDSACEACETRRNNGAHVHSVIPLPPALVSEMILDSGVDRSQLTPEITADLIKKRLRGELKQFAELLAFANGSGVDTDTASGRLRLELSPGGVILYSSSVAEDPNDPEVPGCNFDWVSHNEVFSDGWMSVTNN
ncbi:hypothetical protein HYDPIDRAFT_114189 [Hydnomerulius pinastri MD-312]|uniref:tyrosinase n=1 Tax=Hydnomerulius pinastri MD-312 TaxID=994086 RepID=A0A0C9WDK0_9AGAM|nr:hypothetical protein HYDPIDRAFT_114189 [Hydnomerulius pinastri MD-312]